MSSKTADDFDLNALVDAWPSPIVSRSEVGTFSGGVLNPRTMANLDCLGEGPRKITVGKKVCYGTVDLVGWMKKRQGWSI